MRDVAVSKIYLYVPDLWVQIAFIVEYEIEPDIDFNVLDINDDWA
jgi:hypothetical protein